MFSSTQMVIRSLSLTLQETFEKALSKQEAGAVH